MTGPTTQGGPGRVSQTKPGSSYLPKPRLMFRPAQSVFNMLKECIAFNCKKITLLTSFLAKLHFI